VFDGDRQLQEDLQQQGSKQGHRKRIDSNVPPVLGEQIQHQEIDQDCGEIPHEQPLSVRGGLRRGR
jgi:hypothetical protein